MLLFSFSSVTCVPQHGCEGQTRFSEHYFLNHKEIVFSKSYMRTHVLMSTGIYSGATEWAMQIQHCPE